MFRTLIRRFSSNTAATATAAAGPRSAAVNSTTKPLSGSLSYYSRHILIGTRLPISQWPPSFEQLESIDIDNHQFPPSINLFHSLSKTLKSRLSARSDGYQPKLTLFYPDGCSTIDGESIIDSSILVFPDYQLYPNVRFDQLSALIEDILTIPNPELPIHRSSINRIQLSQEKHAFALVCAHSSRDSRCGTKGSQLLNTLMKITQSEHQPQPQILHPYATSHLGGHSYAANLMLYPRGDCFGLVQPDAVESILTQYYSQNNSTPASAPVIPSIPYYQSWRPAVAVQSIDSNSIGAAYSTAAPASASTTPASIDSRINYNHWRGRLGLSPDQQRAEARAAGIII